MTTRYVAASLSVTSERLPKVMGPGSVVGGVQVARGATILVINDQHRTRNGLFLVPSGRPKGFGLAQLNGRHYVWISSGPFKGMILRGENAGYRFIGRASREAFDSEAPEKLGALYRQSHDLAAEVSAAIEHADAVAKGLFAAETPKPNRKTKLVDVHVPDIAPAAVAKVGPAIDPVVDPHEEYSPVAAGHVATLGPRPAKPRKPDPVVGIDLDFLDGLESK